VLSLPKSPLLNALTTTSSVWVDMTTYVYAMNTSSFLLQVILNPKVVAKLYLRIWFFPNFISSFSFDYLAYATIGKDNANIAYSRASRAVRFIRITRILGLIKLLRITKLLRFIQKGEDVSEIIVNKHTYHAFLCMQVVLENPYSH